jgi:hypothetical protein
LLAGDVIGQEVEQRPCLLTTKVLIERTARLGALDRYDDRCSLQRVRLGAKEAGAASVVSGASERL